jgi:uncharacterized SAM-binding protein YcdF (DUF218 family)
MEMRYYFGRYTHVMTSLHSGSPRWSLVRRTWRFVGFCLWALAVLVLVVTFTPLVQWWAYQYAKPWMAPKGDVLVVLSGSEGPRGMIGYDSYIRSEYALLAYQDNKFRTILLSGGGRERPVADSMRDFLQCQGIPATVLKAETTSMSTRENALNAAAGLRGEAGTVVLLTSDYHMFRAYRTFQKAGLNVTADPVPDVIKRAGTWDGRWPAFLDLVTETVKIGYYKTRGWI